MKRLQTAVPCPLCPAGMAKPAVDVHHLRPLNLGGQREGPQIKICASCHDQLHRYEKMLVKGLLRLDSLPVNPPWRQVLTPLMEQHAIFAQTGRADEARRMVSASLSEEELRMAHAVKKAAGFTNIDSMIKGLIRGAYRQLMK